MRGCRSRFAFFLLEDINEPLDFTGDSSAAGASILISEVLQFCADEEVGVTEAQKSLGRSSATARDAVQTVRRTQNNRQIFIGEFSGPGVYATHDMTVESIGVNLDPDADLSSSTSSEPISIGQYSDPEEDEKGAANSVQISFGDFKDSDREIQRQCSAR